METNVAELEQATEELTKPVREIQAAHDESLTFATTYTFTERRKKCADDGYMSRWEYIEAGGIDRREIGDRRDNDSRARTDGPERRGIESEQTSIASGILWIPPFVNDFWSGRRVKPKAAKCTCQCGHKHASKTEKERVGA